MTNPVPTAVAKENPAAPNGFAIETVGLKKTYSEGLVFKKRFEALKGVSLQVHRGEIFGLLGPNGAGKTTFLKILLGIIRKTEGDAQLLGYPAGSREGRRLVGYLPEHLRVPAHLTGYQALEFFGNLSNVPTPVVRQKRQELLELVGLAQRAKDGVKQYSKGMLQRLGLAQALLHDPELLVLDEPTDGLDPRARAEMRQIIRDLQKRGVTIFLNSHLLQEVEMVCQRVAILDKGVLRYCGPVSEAGNQVKGKPNLPDGGIAKQGDTIAVTFELQGDAAAIETCFPEGRFQMKEANGDWLKIAADFKDQSEIDAAVDRLRQAGASLISLNRSRVSLEDAFLHMVDESSFKN